MAEATMTPPQPAMDTMPQNAPAGGFIKFFVPGLILGLVLGLFAGAFLMPLIENKVEQLMAPQGVKPSSKSGAPATTPVPDERMTPPAVEGDKPAGDVPPATGTPATPATPADAKPADAKPAPAPAPAPK